MDGLDGLYLKIINRGENLDFYEKLTGIRL